MISGPQPETTRDYQVIGVDEAGKETVLTRVLDNHYRLRLLRAADAPSAAYPFTRRNPDADQ